ncbi:MAG: hypothetical protein IPN83_04145 [Holophagales bacterium]|nr:hypothetical protein [Holophagales bacterium]
MRVVESSHSDKRGHWSTENTKAAGCAKWVVSAVKLGESEADGRGGNADGRKEMGGGCEDEDAGLSHDQMSDESLSGALWLGRVRRGEGPGAEEPGGSAGALGRAA